MNRSLADARWRLRPASLLASTLVTLLIVAAVLLLAQAPLMGWLEAQVSRAPWLSIPAFVLFMAVWSLTTLSAIPFMLLAGGLFGPWLGAAWALAGMMLGAWATFVIGRRWRVPMQRLLDRYGRLRQVGDLMTGRPLLTVVVVRAVVGFPLSLLRYALAAAGVSRRDYLVGSLLAIVPGVILYSGLGRLAFEVLHERDVAPPTVLFVGVAALVAVAFAVMIQRYRRQRGA